MDQAEAKGMQRLARKGIEKRVAATAHAIDRIADQRVAHVGHVHPDLVRAPCLELAFDQSAARDR